MKVTAGHVEEIAPTDGCEARLKRALLVRRTLMDSQMPPGATSGNVRLMRTSNQPNGVNDRKWADFRHTERVVSL